MRTYHVGILGSGVISRTYLADIQKFYHELQVTACADLDPGRAQALAGEFGVPKACTPEQLLGDDAIDIVVNLTPPQAHVAVDRQVIAAGKHLFSEKPFAPTLREAQELLDLAAQKGVQVGCAPDTFLASGLQSMRYYLDAGLIGRPFFVTANMTGAGVETWHPNPGPFYRQGAGPVMDMGPYYLSAIVALLGPIESIAAFSARPQAERRVYTGPQAGGTVSVETPTHYSAVLRLRSGAAVNLNLSFDVYRSNLPLFEIYGDEGTLTYPDPNFGGGTPQVYRKEQFTDLVYRQDAEAKARSERFYPLPELFTRAKDYSRGIGVLDLARAIETGQTARTGGALLLHVTEAMEGLLQAAQQGSIYRMTTTCTRPRPLAPGSALDEV